MANFIAFIFCMFVGIYDIHNDYFGLGLFQIAMALINLPFAIEWLITLF